MADQTTDFQIALLHQLADLADVIDHKRDVNPNHRTDRDHEAIARKMDIGMHGRAAAFEAKYGQE